MKDIVIVPVSFFHWNKDRVIEKVSQEIEQLDQVGAIVSLNQDNLAFHTLGQLTRLLKKADTANSKFKFTNINTVYKLLKHVNDMGDEFSPYNLAVLFSRFELSPSQMRELFMYFPELIERIPRETLQKYAAQSVLLAECLSHQRNLSRKLLFDAKEVYETLERGNHLSLWWFERASSYGLETAVELALSAEKYLDANNFREKLSVDIQDKLKNEIQSREILESQIIASQEALKKLSWYQWGAIYRVKAQIKNAQLNIINMNNNILEICSQAGIGKNTIAQRALDVFLKRQASAVTKKQSWENFEALKAIRPKYNELLDERHVEALFALADSPEKFLDVIRYLCCRSESRRILTKFLKNINILSLQDMSPISPFSQMAASAANPSVDINASPANVMQESILPVSQISEVRANALQNIKRYLQNGALIKEEDAPLGEAEWGDNFGARCLSNYPQIAKAIYFNHPQILANDIKKYVRHPNAIIRFIVKNRHWLNFEHLVFISSAIQNQNARKMFLNLDFVKEKLRRGIDDIIASNSISSEKNSLLVMALKQNDVREAVNLIRKRSRNEKLYDTNVVAAWINHSLTGPENRKHCNDDVAKIIAGDSYLLRQVRDPNDIRAFLNQFCLTNNYFDAANAVYLDIERYSGWFSSGKDEFIQEFITDLKKYPANQERCFIIANNADLFQRLKNAYIGKQYFWGLFGPSKQTIKQRRTELKNISEHFKSLLKRKKPNKEKQNKVNVVSSGNASAFSDHLIEQQAPLQPHAKPVRTSSYVSFASVNLSDSYEKAPQLDADLSSTKTPVMTNTAETADQNVPARSVSLSSAESFTSSVLSVSSVESSSLKPAYNAHGLLADKQSNGESPVVEVQKHQAAEAVMISDHDSAAVSAAHVINKP